MLPMGYGEWRLHLIRVAEPCCLQAGDKSDASQKRFYREFIKKADDRYDAHLSRLPKKKRK